MDKDEFVDDLQQLFDTTSRKPCHSASVYVILSRSGHSHTTSRGEGPREQVPPAFGRESRTIRLWTVPSR